MSLKRSLETNMINWRYQQDTFRNHEVNGSQRRNYQNVAGDRAPLTMNLTGSRVHSFDGPKWHLTGMWFAIVIHFLCQVAITKQNRNDFLNITRHNKIHLLPSVIVQLEFSSSRKDDGIPCIRLCTCRCCYVHLSWHLNVQIMTNRYNVVSAMGIYVLTTCTTKPLPKSLWFPWDRRNWICNVMMPRTT